MPNRSANRDELRALIVAALGNLTVDQALARLDAAGIANASVNDRARLWAHPQLAARGRWTEVQTAVGAIPALWPPGMDEARMDPVPAPGQHTAQILAELGY